jgi:cytidylate kinase
MGINIAIDGPSGAGKSTISKRIAKILGFVYIDTGAMYRAVGLYTFRKGKDPKAESEVAPLLKDIKLNITYDNDGARHIWLNDEDVSQFINSSVISAYASDVSALPLVREFLLDAQREIADNNNVIMDGRDIGTVVLPDAQLKIFLKASPQDRAKRRFEELKEKGTQVNLEDVLNDIIKRDEQDSNREVAPLKPADDAIIVDTTGFEIEKSYKTLCNLCNKRLNLK